MKTIPLTRGQVTLVDNKDFKWLSQWQWYAYLNRGKYRAARGNYTGCDILTGKPIIKTIYMAREIIQASDEFLVDHADGNTLNNQRRNLRLATSSQNTVNSGNPDLYKGVYFRKATQKQQVYIRKKCLGTFKTEDEAAIIYNKAAKEEYGGFAYLNQIMRHRNIKERESVNQLI